MGGQQVCNQACRLCMPEYWRRCDSDYTIGDFFFARKVDFGAKMRRAEMQERATDVGPCMGVEISVF